MITLHENGRTYKVGLRAQYKHPRSEKAVRAAVAQALAYYDEQGWTGYAAGLAKHSIIEQMQTIGMI